MMNCTLLLILGSSLVVHPIAGLLGLALKNGAKIIIVNLQATPYDRYAHVVIKRQLGEFYQEILVDRIDRV
ncbi:MAG: hypothetical protein SWO11_03520 [Thermodesulfobacteriota bacterium]|nr:hypothetical protein [Thermodesulfobacteriota bacterium]